MYSLSKGFWLFGFSNETNGQANQLKCQLRNSEMEIKSSRSHWASWHTNLRCLPLCTNRRRKMGRRSSKKLQNLFGIMTQECMSFKVLRRQRCPGQPQSKKSWAQGGISGQGIAMSSHFNNFLCPKHLAMKNKT